MKLQFRTACLIVLFTVPTAANAQRREIRAIPGAGALVYQSPPEVLESAPLESIALVKNAPFSAEAVTEFTQILGDGNRIDRRYASSIARDSRGRTRREEEIAMVGSLAISGATPKLVTIVDPDARVSYTLDGNLRVVYRNGGATAKVIELDKMSKAVGAARVGKPGTALPVPPLVANQKLSVAGDVSASKVVTEKLAPRTIEGVATEGTRTTMTIPAGAIGNLQPIEVVTERWFSPELQMAVLITRRDPRAGETAYRLTNIVRAEPPNDLFTVPPDYQVREGKLGGVLMKKLEGGLRK
jgi:hypothetical protein